MRTREIFYFEDLHGQTIYLFTLLFHFFNIERRWCRRRDVSPRNAQLIRYSIHRKESDVFRTDFVQFNGPPMHLCSVSQLCFWWKWGSNSNSHVFFFRDWLFKNNQREDQGEREIMIGLCVSSETLEWSTSFSKGKRNYLGWISHSPSVWMMCSTKGDQRMPSWDVCSLTSLLKSDTSPEKNVWWCYSLN